MKLGIIIEDPQLEDFLLLLFNSMFTDTAFDLKDISGEDIVMFNQRLQQLSLHVKTLMDDLMDINEILSECPENIDESVYEAYIDLLKNLAQKWSQSDRWSIILSDRVEFINGVGHARIILGDD